MNIHIAIANPVAAALKQTFGLTENDLAFTGLEEAQLVIVEDKESLLKLHRPYKHFVVMSSREPQNLPKNAEWLSSSGAVVGFINVLARLRATKPEASAAVVSAGQEPLCSLRGDGECRILVVDDTKVNRDEARKLLPNAKELVIAPTYGDAMTVLTRETFDYVLTDLYLPMSRFHGALAVDAMKIGELVPYGFLIALEATKGGARVGVVTDANHHADCFSAAFDHFNQPFVMNYRWVQFFNYGSPKNWLAVLQLLTKIPPTK